MADSFKDLIAWQKAMALAKAVYLKTAGFPSSEVYGPVIQMRRAAVSIASNIAEGKGRHSQRDFQHFVVQARGSLNELETQLMLSADLGFLTKESSSELISACQELGKILSGLINSLAKSAGA